MADLDDKLTNLVLRLKGDAVTSSSMRFTDGVLWAIECIRKAFPDANIDDAGRSAVHLQDGSVIMMTEQEDGE